MTHKRRPNWVVTALFVWAFIGSVFILGYSVGAGIDPGSLPLWTWTPHALMVIAFVAHLSAEVERKRAKKESES